MIYGQAQELWRALPFIERARPASYKWIANPHALRYQDDLAAARRCRELGVELVVRVADFSPAQGQDVDPVEEAWRFIGHCKAQEWWGLHSAIETPNEPWPSLETPPWYVQFQMLLESHIYAPVIVGNFGTRQPIMGFPPHAGLLGAHYYWWDGGPLAWGLDDWLAELDGIMAANPDMGLVVTEAGRTRALIQPEVLPGQDYELGWHAAGMFGWQYWNECLLVDTALTQRFGTRYRGMFLFGMGMHPGGRAEEGWGAFETLDTEVETLMEQQAKNAPPLHAGPILAHGGVGMAEYRFGFADKAAELGESVVGKPLEEEQYIGDNYAFQMTEKGVMVYSKQANTVRFLAGR